MKDNYPNKFVFEAEKFNILIVEDSISMLKMLNQNFLDNKFNSTFAHKKIINFLCIKAL